MLHARGWKRPDFLFHLELRLEMPAPASHHAPTTYLRSVGELVNKSQERRFVTHDTHLRK